jgi:hypothetical protein
MATKLVIPVARPGVELIVTVQNLIHGNKISYPGCICKFSDVGE